MRDGKKTWLGHIGQMLVLGIASVILGVLLLTLVFCLPVEPVKEHVGVSVDRIIPDASQGETKGWKGYLDANRELYTDAIMVQNAFEKIPGKNAFEHAMWAYHLDLSEEAWTPEVSVKYYSQGGDPSAMFLHQYSRYWHGYLVFLKPLLLLFTWEQVVWIGAGLQILLFLAVVFFAFRKGHPEAAAALLLSLLFLKPLLMLASLAMTVCGVITLAAVLAVLLWRKELEQKELYPQLFLMTGILVAYFDFLTYPVVTLGFPLCVYFLTKKDAPLKENVARMLAYSASWTLGYLAMWCTKWVLADLTLHTGTIRSAVSSIVGWTEAVGGRPRVSGGLYVIGMNLQAYQSWIYPVLAALLAVADLAALCYAVRKTSWKRALSYCVPYLLTACIPFGWYIVVQHHSGMHVVFTFRILSVVWLAFCAIGLGLWRMGRQGQRKEET